MVDKPADNKPAMEHGEVKVIKNAPPPGSVDPCQTPGSAEAGPQQGEPTGDPSGKPPGSAGTGNPELAP